MINVLNSPLLDFVKKQLAYRGKYNIRQSILQEAQSALNNRIVNCCLHQQPVRNNSFLNMFFTLMNNMDQKEDMPKLVKVKTTLDNAINCCN